MSKKPYTRPRLSEVEAELISQYRERHKALKKECEAKGIPIEDVKHYWHKSEHFSLFVKQQGRSFEDFQKDIIKEFQRHSPTYQAYERKPIQDAHALVLDPADIHIGKLASTYETRDEYNVQIACDRVTKGVESILSKAAPYNIDKVFLIVGNDVLHTDTPRRTTTSGTPQDTDGMWYDNFLAAKRLFVEVIESLIPVADLHVVYNPSNHDYMTGFFFAQTLESWFRNSPNVTFSVDMTHRKYFTYGENLIGTTHGDGAKTNDLPLLMANEAMNHWTLKYKYWYTHHVHHKTAKDIMNVCIESMRSLSGTDSWHSRNGYQHAPKTLEGFIHSKEHGQVARLTQHF